MSAPIELTETEETLRGLGFKTEFRRVDVPCAYKLFVFDGDYPLGYVYVSLGELQMGQLNMRCIRTEDQPMTIAKPRARRCQIAQGMCGNRATKSLSYRRGDASGPQVELRHVCDDALCNQIASMATTLGLTIVEGPILV